MLTQGTGFARYSKSLCWIVALIWMVLSFLAFTGGSGSSIINDFLWLAGAIAFAVSASFISKSSGSAESDSDDD
jgi:hypothetical protein